MTKATMSVIKRGTAMVYKFSEPVSREHADAMIQMHKDRERAAKKVISNVFYAMGPNCWGKGRTLNEATRNALENFPRHYPGVKRPQCKHLSAWLIARDDGTELKFSDIGVNDIDGAFSTPKGCTVMKLQTSTLAVQS